MDKLVHCPFCKGNDVELLGYFGMFYIRHVSNDCVICGTTGSVVSKCYRTKKQAVAAWNKCMEGTAIRSGNPKRNCDRFDDMEEAQATFAKEVCKGRGSCSECDETGDCRFKWLFAPVKQAIKEKERGAE